MKIEFAPLHVPLRRRLQTAAVVQWVFSFLALAQVCLALFVLLCVSDWWILGALYAGWLYLDRDTPSSGGRRSHWVRSWRMWTYFRDYFPITLIKTVDLDPRHNYLFGFHPHGLVSSEKASASYLLSRPGGGHAAVIAVGGAPESLDARPGADRLQRIMGVAMPLFHARGVFQYSFGLLPYRKPIHTVVGHPIPVTQNPSPNKDDIDALHSLYMKGLTQLFEENKKNYGIPEDKHLDFI
ncbi:2-acylglycerol O-acyltransferase 2-A [Anabarilius grahami]|uniref:2-acylglycerol O-acyltransferase 2-A n=1 Tax=Anabarilius grahami TaxID=495550 RepID=A0A3N0Y0Q9_ANAGA|nr:2-acylglycerol O-acyltransferase 2-A [Anabarilius grahami]